MNTKRQLFLFFISILTAFTTQAGRIERAFDALTVYDYFKAKALFTKSLKTQESISSYGLATIFYRHDNPFHSLDSAYVYINRSKKAYATIKVNAKQRYIGFVNDLQIDSLRQLISSTYFEKALTINTVDGFQSFINNHTWAKEVPIAVHLRDSIAFEHAKEINTSISYADFTTNYPTSDFSEAATALLMDAQYTEITASKTLESYTLFLQVFPENSNRNKAETAIYDIVTKPNTTASLELFLEIYPTNHLVNLAWERLYQLNVYNYSAENINAFAKKYPNYPYLEKLETDLSFIDFTVYPFEKNGRFGFMDSTGTSVIPAQYSSVSPFKEGLALVSRGDKFGYINKKGEEVIDFIYSGGSDFEQGRAVIERYERYGMIDRTGIVVFKPEFKELGSISEGLIYGLKDSLYAYYNTMGDQVIPERFTDAYSFSNGRAKIEEKGLQAYIDNKGEYIVYPAFQEIEFFTDSLLIYGDGDTYGLMKPSCQIVVPNKYESIGQLSEGLAIIQYEDLIGYINERGEIVIKPQYDPIPNFLNRCQFKAGSAVVAKNGSFGVINTSGKDIIPLKNEEIGEFTHLIAVKRKGKWGYINRANQLIITPAYSFAESFKSSIAIVQESSLMGVIDKAGNKIIETGYNNIELTKSGYLIINNGALYGIASERGQIVVPLIYRSIRVFNENLLILTDKDGISYFDCNKRILLKHIEND